MDNFTQFKLKDAVLGALEAIQFHHPTPIQSQAIPVALAGRDLIGCAQTGTGKTAAFSIPILNRLLGAQGESGLVLVPTRELAVQIHAFWRTLTARIPRMSSAVIIGGAAMQPQVRALRAGPRLIVATPGRLVDHLTRGTVRLSSVGTLVLDEADRILDMGFAPQLSEVMRHLPKVRQTLLFSATWDSALDHLARRHLQDPMRINIGAPSRTSSQVSQELVMTTSQRKNEALLDQLNQRPGSILVFARTKSRTDRVARYLSEYGVDVNRLHGGRTQGQRNSALSAFRNGQVRVLVATDIAARGLDVAEIEHVVNYDLPQSSEDYVHRIGRTGGAGRTGQAVSLITPEDRSQWREIARLLERTGSRVPCMPGAESRGKNG